MSETGLHTEQETVARLEIDTDDGGIMAADLVDFLSVFETTYELAAAAFDNDIGSLLPLVLHQRGDTRLKPDDVESLQPVMNSVCVFLWRAHDAQATLPPEYGSMYDRTLKIRSMSMQSPLFMDVVVYSVIALVAAVILSGGSVDFGVASFKLPPLGQGIASLRRAFSDQGYHTSPKLREHVKGVDYNASYKPPGF